MKEQRDIRDMYPSRMFFNDNERIVGFELIKTLSSNVALSLRGAVWGNISVHYSPILDSLEIQIKNRALAIEPFRYTYPELSKEVKLGLSSSTIANFVLSEYRDYVEMYIWKRG